MKGNTESPAPAAALPNLKALNPYRSTSPPKKTPAKTHQEFARGSYREESVNDFVDLHRTFYTSLAKKIKIDTQTKKTNSIFKDSTLHASRRAVSVNTGIADQNSDATFIKRNIQKVIEKPPVKQFKYLQEDERIRRAIEPKRLIRGLDDLYSRIDRIFVKQSDDEDFSPRQQIREYQKSVVHGNPDRSPSKTPEPKLFVKQKDVKVLVKKKSQSNLTKDDKPEAVANGIEKDRVLVKTKADNLEISFEGAWKKENKGKLPQIRSSSQPRASTKTQAKSSLISPIAVPTETPEAEVANKSISGPASEKFDYKFQKMMTYAEKGGLDPLGSEENRISLKDLFQTQSAEKIEKVEKEPPKENKSKSPAPTKKGKKPVDDTPLDHNLPARPVIKSLKDETFIMENYTLNKNMSVMLGNTLGQKPELKVLALINNKLTDETISALLEPVMADPKDIEVFRCVKNSIGEKFISIFEKKFFSLGKNCLKELTLDGCTISEKDLDAVLYVLNGARPRLKHLGLAKVGLNEQAIRTLCRLIVNSEFLTSLDLGWNNMNKECIRILLEGIKVNQSIRYLDLSWSSLAHADNKNAKTLKEIIVKSNQLVHLNLSHTDLSDSDVTLIIEGVRRSRNVVAVHLGGNHMTALMIERINEFLGAKKSVYENILSPFNESLENKVYSNVQSGCTYSCKGPESDKLKKAAHDHGKSPKKENTKDLDEVDENNPLSYKESEHLIYSRILDNDVTHDGDVWVQSNNCWVCERWKKIQISYKIPKPKQKEKEVQEHNSQRSEKPRSTRVQRMSQDFIDDVEIDVPKGEREDVKIVGSFTKNQHVKMVYDNQARSYEYSVYMPPGNHQYKIDWFRYGAGADQVLLEGKIAVLPRESKIHPMQDPLKKNSLIVGNEEFVKERSVFADFRHDEDSVLRKAFETDIRKFTMYDFLKKRNELDKILIFLYKNFEIIKSVFIHYAAISLYPYISFEKMLELLEECEAFDFDFKRSDVTKTCIVTRDSDETTQAPQDGLNRHNFIEVLVKVAPIKYNPKRAPEIQAELIERFFEEFIFKKGKKTLQHYHDFRVKKIYTGTIDKLLKANIDGLEEIFKKKRQLFGIKIESLKEIAQASKIDINDKDLNLLAAYSKMTIIDEEKDSKKYGLLVFVEFLEFLVRLAEHTVKEGELIEKLGVTLEKILKSHDQNFHKSLSEI